MNSACCGQPVRRRQRAPTSSLPPNPKVIRGTILLYLGGGSREIRGPATNLVYYVSEHRRKFTVDGADAAPLLRQRELILAP